MQTSRWTSQCVKLCDMVIRWVVGVFAIEHDNRRLKLHRDLYSQLTLDNQQAVRTFIALRLERKRSWD